MEFTCFCVDFTWVCLVLHGFTWFCMGLLGFVRFCVDLYCVFCLDLNGFTWSEVTETDPASETGEGGSG